MTRTERMLLVYAVTVGGAAGIAYARGKRGVMEIGRDAILHGALAGTGANVCLWLYDEHTQTLVPAVVGRALPNESDILEKKGFPYGRVAEEGLRLLSEIDQKTLYRAAKMAGVSIGPSPEDPNIVVLPES